MFRLKNAKLESDSESDSEVEPKSDTILMAKLKSNSDSGYIKLIFFFFWTGGIFSS